MSIKEIQKFDPYDLIKFLNQEARKDYQDNEQAFNAGMAFMLACVRKYFNDDFDIPIRDNNGWISVDDELPIICTPVQVCMSDNRVWTGFYDPVIKKGWYIYGWNTNPFTVTHWQPLPEPPKE